MLRDVSEMSPRVYPTLPDFLGERDLPSGVLTVEGTGLPIDLRFQRRGGACLLVMFTAAVPKDCTVPRFTGAGISRGLDADVLYVSDPSLVRDPELFLAWYTGSVQQDFRSVFVDIIGHLMETGNYRRTVFFGGSAGGFASLYFSAQIPGSVAVPTNPQTNLAHYSPPLVRRWARTCWEATGSVEESLFDIPVCTDLVSLYRQPSDNEIAYIQNRQDDKHVGPHMAPFLEATRGRTSVRYILGDWGVGHKPPPKELLQETLATVMDAGDRTERLHRLGFEKNE